MLRRRPAASSTTSTSPSLVWKTYFCITPEGVCGIELENVFRPAFARRACGPPQPGSHAHAEPAAASAVHLCLRPCDDEQRHDAGGIQEHAAAGDHGDQ